MISQILIPIVAVGAGFAAFRSGPSIPKKVYEEADLTGGVAIVTGGTNGIGLETVKAIAALEHAPDIVFLTYRSEAAGKKARDEVLAHARAAKQNIKEESVRLLQLDLADLESVNTFSKEIESKGYDVKLLVMNAGVMTPEHSVTKQGIEVQWGTNHIGHFYLAKLLFDNLKKNSARVVVVSSRAGERAKELDLNDNVIYGPASQTSRMDLYCRSKISNYLFARELQERFSEGGQSRAVAVSLHPGVIASNLFSSFVPSSMHGFASFLTALLLKTPEAGARTSLLCSLTKNPVPGSYYKDCMPAVNTSPIVKDQDRLQKELWAKSEEVLANVLSTKRE